VISVDASLYGFARQDVSDLHHPIAVSSYSSSKVRQIFHTQCEFFVVFVWFWAKVFRGLRHKKIFILLDRCVQNRFLL
jgi:hypothetical protein